MLAGLISLTELASASWVLLAGSGVICVAFPLVHPLIVIGGGALINFVVVVLN